MECRLDEEEYDLAVLLSQHAQGLSFAELVAATRRGAQAVYESLTKLQRRNHISLLQKRYAQYAITPANAPLTLRRVQCPTCRTIRRVHDERQERATCINLACRTPSGMQRQFEIISRELLKKGIRQRVHEAGEPPCMLAST